MHIQPQANGALAINIVLLRPITPVLRTLYRFRSTSAYYILRRRKEKEKKMVINRKEKEKKVVFNFFVILIYLILMYLILNISHLSREAVAARR